VERDYGVDVLRGLAAVAVAYFHFTNGNAAFLGDDSILRLSGVYGYLGVSAFFVISGYVIPLAMDRRGYQFPKDALDFGVRRIIRLEPAYLCSIMITLALGVISAMLPFINAAMPAVSVADVALHVAYLAPWFDVKWILPVYWSLAIEFQFYFFMLLAAPLLLTNSTRTAFTFLMAVAAAAFVSADVRLIFCYLPLFGLGFCLFLLRTQRIGGFAFAFWATIFFAMGIFTQNPAVMLAALVACAFILLVRISRPVPVLTFLGTISYSIYLLHVPAGGRVINFATRFSEQPAIQIAAILLALVVTIVAACLLWRFVERPTMHGHFPAPNVSGCNRWRR
jgi:peptidoglycan/LPS O-acetylase OafA/YrhL